jgi:hypothetical protein
MQNKMKKASNNGHVVGYSYSSGKHETNLRNKRKVRKYWRNKFKIFENM